MAKLAGKIAVVSGATGGLGHSVVLRLIQDGATVIGTHTGSTRSLESAKSLRSISASVRLMQVETTEPNTVGVLFDTIQREFGAVHILCNLIGGISAKKRVEEVEDEEWFRTFRLNVDSAFFMIRKALPLMTRNGFGRIVTIGAMAAVTAEPLKSAYAASKAALLALTQTVAAEVKGTAFDITANAIVPSVILTEANRSWGTPEEQRRWVTPEEIAGLISFLCGNDARSVNGSIIHMEGKVTA